MKFLKLSLIVYFAFNSVGFSADWTYGNFVLFDTTSSQDTQRLIAKNAELAAFNLAWVGSVPAPEPNQITFSDPLQDSSGSNEIQQRIADNIWKVNKLTEGMPLDKNDATTDPTVNDDSSEGYSIGSFWHNITSNKSFVALDVSVGAAVWIEITSSGVGTDPSFNSVTLTSGGGIDAVLDDGSGDYSLNLGVVTGSTASGDNSIVAGGSDNDTSGNYSGIYAGLNNTINGGVYNGIISGQGGIVGSSGNHAGILFGQNNTVNGVKSVAIGGLANTLSAPSSFSLGDRNTVNAGANFALVRGFRAVSRNYGEFTSASGFFDTDGDAQVSRVIFRDSTGGATPSEMFLDGSSERCSIEIDHVYSGVLTVLATSSAANAKHAHYRRELQIWNNAGTTALLGTVDVIGSDYESDAGMDVTVSADDTNDSIKIEVTGIASTTIRWVAELTLNTLKMP